MPHSVVTVYIGHVMNEEKQRCPLIEYNVNIYFTNTGQLIATWRKG